ncbi:MAG TPA: nitroreductase family deazaflavin-dependent oxidoreductase [Methylomirabilota bacterium]|jgi:deazaflavin-dependent oxidoreductase (nitroreductase family)|nr:nitroreductase family deazaflavin-dependent oxidoreductase [Methylomirabilota bacterium]
MSRASLKSPFLYLTTSGRRTGRPREIEIWYSAHAGRYYVIAEHGERAQWVKNLRAEPAVSVRVGRRRLAARARVLDRPRDAAACAAARARSEAKYGWGDGLVVELAPSGRSR